MLAILIFCFYVLVFFFFFFFFQAEDGIRDFHVTGVQTCALPISDANQSVSIVERELHPVRSVADIEDAERAAMADAARIVCEALRIEALRLAEVDRKSVV